MDSPSLSPPKKPLEISFLAGLLGISSPASVPSSLSRPLSFLNAPFPSLLPRFFPGSPPHLPPTLFPFSSLPSPPLPSPLYQNTTLNPLFMNQKRPPLEFKEVLTPLWIQIKIL
jgi:hypothetical protein